MSTGFSGAVGTFPYTSSFDSLTAAMSSMTTSPPPLTSATPYIQSLMDNPLSTASSLMQQQGLMSSPQSIAPSLMQQQSLMSNPLSTVPSSLQQQSLMFNTPSSLSTTALPFHPANSMNTPSQNASYPIPHQVRVKKAELPHFSGRRCDWAEFKHIWPKMAVPAFQCKEILANELRIHCHGDAEELLRNVKITGAGTIDVMWKRLLDHYEDTASSMNEILKELDELKMVKSEDYRGLTAYINKVEGCYTQISNLNQLASISMRDVNRMSTLQRI